MNIEQMRIDNLRAAIRNNQITFPAQTPVLAPARTDIHWRVVELYFVRGWSCEQLSRRYSLTRRRIGQLVGEWVDRAATLGYLQEIPVTANGFAAILGEEEKRVERLSNMAARAAASRG